MNLTQKGSAPAAKGEFLGRTDEALGVARRSDAERAAERLDESAYRFIADVEGDRGHA